jgi:hypothetical protein
MKNAHCFLIAVNLLLCFWVTTSGAATSGNVDKLPVYNVVQNGLSESQVDRLSEGLKLPRENLALQFGVLSYTGRSPVGTIPTRPATDPELLKKLRAKAQGEVPGASIQYDVFDRNATSETPLPAESAMQLVRTAFAGAGVNVEFGTLTVSNAILAASYKDATGTPISINRKLNTRVSYQFADKTGGIPFVGPGAVVTLTFNSKAEVTHLHYSWRGLKQGVPVAIIGEAEARKRIRQLLPAGAGINLKLVYWCPPFENVEDNGSPLKPKSIIPWYAFTGTIRSKDAVSGSPSHLTTQERLIPATDDPDYVPTIQLKVSGSGSNRVEASAAVRGGLPPYTYAWTGSDPGLLRNKNFSVSYTPIAPEKPSQSATPAQAVPMDETVSVTVSDSNGIAIVKSQTIQVQAQPITPNSSSVAPSEPSYGCESPAEPDQFSSERKGWEAGMSNPGGGRKAFSWVGDTSWPGDYIKPSPPAVLPKSSPWINGDADVNNWGINTANLVLIIADGEADRFTAMYPGADFNSDYYHVYLWRPCNPNWTVQMPDKNHPVNYKASWGPVGPNDRLYWLAGLLCDCLDETDGNMLKPCQRWGPAFNGLHIFTGFVGLASSSTRGKFTKTFAEYILGVTGPAMTIWEAWFNACIDTDEGECAAIGPIDVNGVSDISDHYIGKGNQGPTIVSSEIAGWWYLKSSGKDFVKETCP